MSLEDAREWMRSQHGTRRHLLDEAQAHALISIAESLEKLASCVRDNEVNEYVTTDGKHVDKVRPYLRTRG